IIAHIDHGKSTLADRLLQMTGTVAERDMHAQLLDGMELERERGVTIKASAVKMQYVDVNKIEYELNLIDTPGHVDFSYEVSRALAACEGALLVVDASQGVEAQTLANLYLALETDLDIIPVINKIDLEGARTAEVTDDICELLGVDEDEILTVSAKTGTNVESVLEAIVKYIRPPELSHSEGSRGLVFDSHYDPYKGVVIYVRMKSGNIDAKDRLSLLQSSVSFEPLEIGVFSPEMEPTGKLLEGQVGYVATGIKNVSECRVGDTIVEEGGIVIEPLAGYRPVKPMVYAGFFPVDGDDYQVLKDAVEKLQLNDAALVYTPESSHALNFGFRCGFLGMFHMEIVQERLEREYDLDIIATAPSVEYEVETQDGDVITVKSPAGLPDEGKIQEIREPWMVVNLYLPATYYGVVMELVTKRRGVFVEEHHSGGGRLVLVFKMPLSELIVDFFDKLKSSTRGYGSLDYQFDCYRAGDLVKLSILVNEQSVDALAMIVHRDEAYSTGQRLITKLKKLIPRQLYPVAIQAAAGGRIISRANVRALRKDVLAKCYGGDVTRKKKLLAKQKEGRKRLKMVGNVEIPQDAFMAVLRVRD
ncbi:MAG TPA: elongation factor 4, partial [Chloroflexi bacterium]|nr:elongation factor 4 [Chloroflexota bacterium]